MKSSPSNAAAAPIAAPGKAITEQYKLVEEVQRPRPLRMSRQGKLSVVTMGIALLVFAGVLVATVAIQPARANSRVPRPLVYVLPLGLVALTAYMLQRGLDRQRQLLSNGELVMARVTKQWETRKNRQIRYEFPSPSGETVSRITADYSAQLLEGTTVPVFYDRQDPKKQIALCAAFYEIVLPGER